MLYFTRHLEDIQEAPKTLIRACNEIKETDKDFLACDTGLIPLNYKEDYPEINGSNIQTILIQYAGKYCEDYASDIIATFCDLEPFLKKETDGRPHRWIIGAGFRQMGVDHNSFLISRLNSSRPPDSKITKPDKDYRKILAIDIRDSFLDDKSFNYDYIKRTIMLKNITSHITTLFD